MRRAVLAGTLALGVACNGVRDRAEQIELSVNHVESPSGVWVAGKSIEDGSWTVEIQGRGEQRFRDEAMLPADRKIFWAWDQQDRLWLFDPGESVVRFYSGGPEWTRAVWTLSASDKDQAAYLCRKAEQASRPAPPEDLFPFIVDSKVRGKLAATLGSECKPPEWEF